MTFSRKELRELSNPYTANLERTSIVGSELLRKIHDDCSNLTLSEKYWICNKLQILQDHNDNRLDPYDFICCEDVLFQIRYILYFNNVEGWYPALDWYGEIDELKKKRDLLLLNKSFIEWEQVIKITNHSSELLQNVSTETRHHLKLIDRYCKNSFIGNNRRNYLRKSLILHSKYMFRMVEEYYEEFPDKQYFDIEGNSIVVDSYFFIHTLFRHYGQIIKEYQVGKSYHKEGLDYKNLPNEVLRIIDSYSQVSNGQFDGQKIYFNHNGEVYAIWFRKVKRNISPGVFVEDYRVQTLYPVELSTDLKKLNDIYQIHSKSNNYTFFLNG